MLVRFEETEDFLVYGGEEVHLLGFLMELERSEIRRNGYLLKIGFVKGRWDGISELREKS